MAKKKNLAVIQVRATADHTQPGTHAYRAAGDVFGHQGEVYEHVEAVKGAPEELVDSDEGEDTE